VKVQQSPPLKWGAKFVVVMGLVLSLIGAGGMVLMSATPASATSLPKAFVCKYVGTPGADETLQTGGNPISVSGNAIKGWDGVTIPFPFNDAQGKSVVIAIDSGQPEPDVSQCPKPEGPPPICIKTAAHTHTYDPGVNGGVVTATGEFCGETLFVTPTEWAFTLNSQWPQDLVDFYIFAIDRPGEYPYGNPVDCGQGDIYAQWGSPIVPTSTLSGPSVEFTEKFLHQVSEGPTTWIVQDGKCYTVPDEHTYSDGTASWQCTGEETRPATITFTRTHFVSTWDGNGWSEPEFDYAEDITIPTPENFVANCITPPVLNPGAPTCNSVGTLPGIPANDGYTSSWDRMFDGPGVYTAKFVAILPDNQFVTGDSATVKVTILGKLTGAKDCPTTTTTGLALTGFDNSGTLWFGGVVVVLCILCGVIAMVFAARQRKPWVENGLV